MTRIKHRPLTVSTLSGEIKSLFIQQLNTHKLGKLVHINIQFTLINHTSF